MEVPAIARELAKTHDFVGAAGVVCRLTRALGVHQACILLHGRSGQPLLAVDNNRDATDAHRIDYMTARWRTDPYLESLQAHHVVVENATRDVTELMVPLLEPAGLLGVACYGSREPFTAALSYKLVGISTHLSVHLARLDVTIAESDVLSRLTARQREVASLAVRGCTNGEIGQLLEMSENTVKKHLKDIYERARVDSRTELATLLARRGPRDVTVAERATTTAAAADPVHAEVEHVSDLAITRVVR